MSQICQSKPFFSEAMQFTGGAKNAAGIIRWVRSEKGNAQWIGPSVQMGETLGLRTQFGVARVLPNDWVVKGLRGEFYPIKPDIFSEMFAERSITQGDKVVANV